MTDIMAGRLVLRPARGSSRRVALRHHLPDRRQLITDRPQVIGDSHQRVQLALGQVVLALGDARLGPSEHVLGFLVMVWRSHEVSFSPWPAGWRADADGCHGPGRATHSGAANG